MFLQNQRGGRICFLDIRKPETQQWESGLQAMQDTLHLEKCVNQSLLNLHQLATDSSDTRPVPVPAGRLPGQQVRVHPGLRNHLSDLSNMGFPEMPWQRVRFLDKLTLGKR